MHKSSFTVSINELLLHMTLDGDLDMGAEDKQAGSYTQYVRLIKIHRLPINQGLTHHARLV